MKFASRNERKVRRFTAEQLRLSGDRRWATRLTTFSSFSASRRIGGSAARNRPLSGRVAGGRAD
jgi:hypothetical protein